METMKFILGIGLITALWSCGPGSQERNYAASAETEEVEISNDLVSSSAAVENPKDTTRKFIRTAELKFKVKNVIKSTYDIEDITNRQGGFVTYTNLSSDIENVTTTEVSADSILQSTYYTVTNSMTLRVPNNKLDTTLKEISRNIDFLDYRVIKAQDVALQILSNNLSQKRLGKNAERLTNAIDNRGGKLDNVTNAEDMLLSKQEQADNAKISNLSLADQINFSTIDLLIYQRQAIKNELIPNKSNIDAYTPSFGTKLLESLKDGWSILAGFVVFLAKSWGIILLGLIVYLIYRQYGHKFKK